MRSFTSAGKRFRSSRQVPAQMTGFGGSAIHAPNYAIFSMFPQVNNARRNY
jgi:hypothetical protein